MPDIYTDFDKWVALRLRQTLSGHTRTWVVLEWIKYPVRPKGGTASKSLTMSIRLEEYIGQLKGGIITDEDKEKARNQKENALTLVLEYDYKGYLSKIKAGHHQTLIRLSNERGWFPYRIRQILDAFAQEVLIATQATPDDNEDDPNRLPYNTSALTTNPITGEVSYIRGRGTFPSTEAIKRRGASGRIHHSEPRDRKYSAYTGW